MGRDSRVSGPLFHQVVRAALAAVGADVIDIGLTTTPTCQLAVEHHHAAGGLMISASHNPIEWNALKFIGPTGLFLSAAEGQAMRAGIESFGGVERRFQPPALLEPEARIAQLIGLGAGMCAVREQLLGRGRPLGM